MTKRNDTMWRVLLPLAAALITVGGLCATIRSHSVMLVEEKVRVTSEIKKNDAQHIYFIYARACPRQERQEEVHNMVVIQSLLLQSS